jgi:predicted anti-sigma-YlaC factor YlaD
MTSCDKYQTDIVALFDNEAGDEDLRLAAGHLENCPECRAFSLELIAIRRTQMDAPTPSMSPAARQVVLDGITAAQPGHGKSHRARFPRLGTLVRWAAVVVIGVLAIACLTLDRRAKDLRTRLGAAEQQVAAIHEQAKTAESQERQQKAISALYFRMAELEDRVNRFSPSQRASIPAQAYERPARESNL